MATDNKTLGVYAAIGAVALGVGALIGATLNKPKSLGHVKLTYLQGRGLAETTRLLLVEAGADWEDIRITQDQMKEFKAQGKLPYGQVPILESSRYPNTVFAQSQTIQRFVAKHYGFLGSSLVEQTQIESVLDAIGDIRMDSRVHVYSVPEEKKADGKKKMETESFPKHLAVLENILRANTHGYFVGNQLSLADIQFFNVFWSFKTDYPNVLNAFPHLQALYQRVAERPRIAEWLHKRPVTQF